MRQVALLVLVFATGAASGLLTAYQTPRCQPKPPPVDFAREFRVRNPEFGPAQLWRPYAVTVDGKSVLSGEAPEQVPGGDAVNLVFAFDGGRVQIAATRIR